jgi:hypothetical protein
MDMKFDAAQPGGAELSLIWIASPAIVSGLTISDIHRSESLYPATNILIESSAIVKSLQISQVTIVNNTQGPLDLIANHGTIEHLSLSHIWIEASEGPVRGSVVRNFGKISRHELQQVFAVNASEVIIEESPTP